jgi:hypothetical protein
MPITHDQAKKLIADELNGNGDRKPGWDGRLNSAILVVFGDGHAHTGRDRLVKLAGDKISRDLQSK